MPKIVIFDMDGVIIDSEPIHFRSDKLTMEYFGNEISDDELMKYVGVTNPVMWSELKNKYNIIAPLDEILIKQSYYKDMLFYDSKLTAVNGISDLLYYLKNRKIKIALASSSPKKFIIMILNKLELLSYFDIIVSGEEVEKSKPDPDIFLRASLLLNIEPFSCFVIEDSENGVKAAKKAGMTCVGYKNPGSGVQDLSLADYIVEDINSIMEIIKHLDKSNNAIF